jgi:hypothetical protein
MTGGLIKEYEENLRAYQEQQLRDQHAPPGALPSKAAKGKGRASHVDSAKAVPGVVVNGDSGKKGKRRATPVFTDSETDDD